MKKLLIFIMYFTYLNCFAQADTIKVNIYEISTNKNAKANRLSFQSGCISFSLLSANQRNKLSSESPIYPTQATIERVKKAKKVPSKIEKVYLHDIMSVEPNAFNTFLLAIASANQQFTVVNAPDTKPSTISNNMIVKDLFTITIVDDRRYVIHLGDRRSALKYIDFFLRYIENSSMPPATKNSFKSMIEQKINEL